MLNFIFTNWKSSLFGVIGATFTALALTVGINDFTLKQLLLAGGSALFIAVKGLVSADADKVLPNAKAVAMGTTSPPK